jgi:NADH:ubiquinone oxidoreductase subunit 6 (subunit J)
MSITVTSLINWNDLWKIVVAALVGGTGVVIVFGLLLLGVSRGRTATRPATRLALYTVSGLCGLLLVAVAAAGLYAMTRKPSTPTAKPNATAAMVAPRGGVRPRRGSRFPRSGTSAGTPSPHAVAPRPAA